MVPDSNRQQPGFSSPLRYSMEPRCERAKGALPWRSWLRARCKASATMRCRSIAKEPSQERPLLTARSRSRWPVSRRKPKGTPGLGPSASSLVSQTCQGLAPLARDALASPPPRFLAFGPNSGRRGLHRISQRAASPGALSIELTTRVTSSRPSSQSVRGTRRANRVTHHRAPPCHRPGRNDACFQVRTGAGRP